MADTSSSARYAARQAVLINIMGEETIDGIRAMVSGARAVEAALLTQIGQHFVDGDEDKAAQLRDQMFQVQTLGEIAQRVADEAASTDDLAP